EHIRLRGFAATARRVLRGLASELYPVVRQREGAALDDLVDHDVGVLAVDDSPIQRRREHEDTPMKILREHRHQPDGHRVAVHEEPWQAGVGMLVDLEPVVVRGDQLRTQAQAARIADDRLERQIVRLPEPEGNAHGTGEIAPVEVAAWPVWRPHGWSD